MTIRKIDLPQKVKLVSPNTDNRKTQDFVSTQTKF